MPTAVPIDATVRDRAAIRAVPGVGTVVLRRRPATSRPPRLLARAQLERSLTRPAVSDKIAQTVDEPVVLDV